MSPENQILHFVYTSDERYVLVTEVSILSAYAKASRPRDLVVHELDCGIPDAAWAAFQARVLVGAAVRLRARFPLIGRKASGYKRLFFTKAERRRFLSPAFWRG